MTADPLERTSQKLFYLAMFLLLDTPRDKIIIRLYDQNGQSRMFWPKLYLEQRAYISPVEIPTVFFEVLFLQLVA